MSEPSLDVFRLHEFPDLVRVGSAGDGGYVLPRRLIEGSASLVSVGVGDNWDFEDAFLADCPGAHVHCFDGSVSEVIFKDQAMEAGLVLLGYLMRLRRFHAVRSRDRLTDRLAVLRRFRRFTASERVHFSPRFIATKSDRFHATWREAFASAAVPALVKIDIEGAEYDILDDVIDDRDRISGIILELHDCGGHWRRIERLLARIEPEFVVAHVHGNNCRPLVPDTGVPEVLELTFVHRRFVDGASGPRRRRPLVGLDAPNIPDRPELPLEVR
jgi:hypothetical protein